LIGDFETLVSESRTFGRGTEDVVVNDEAEGFTNGTSWLVMVFNVVDWSGGIAECEEVDNEVGLGGRVDCLELCVYR